MVEKKYIVAIDQGTSATRCIIFDYVGNIVSSEFAEHKQIYPHPGWVEHNPAEILQNTNLVIKNSIRKARIDTKEIAAVGVTNQRETVVLWDPTTGEPVYNAIVWQDTRTKDRCAILRESGMEASLIHPRTGVYAYPYFSSTKIEWILRNVPGAEDKARNGNLLFGNIDTWIIWNLTKGRKNNSTPEKNGAHVTDYTNASRTMLMDLARLEWSSDMLEIFHISSQMAPSLRPSSDEEVLGYTASTGPFGREIPICGDLGDQQAALVGQVCFGNGDTKNTYGTGCFLLSNLGNELKLSRRGLVTTVAYGFEEGKCCYSFEGSIAIAGAAVQWLRDNLNMIKSSADTESLAGSVSGIGSGGVYFVPAFSGLFAPYWDSDARGVMIGLTGYIRKEHLIHATLESICWQTRDVFDLMSLETGSKGQSLKVDGGAVSNNYLMQLQADILGIDVVRPAVTETTSLGAVYAAGLAVGLWSDTSELQKLWRADRVFRPKWDEDRRARLHQGWKVAVERCKAWLKEVGELPSSGTKVD